MQRTQIGGLFCTMLLGSAGLVQATAVFPTSSSVNATRSATAQSQTAAALLRDIRTDAMQIRSAAARLYSMAATSSGTWIEYDRQRNEIKPAEEDMEMKVSRLETMRSALSPAERTELDQAKPPIGEIQSRTHQFLTLLDRPGVPTSDTKFKTYARSLRNEAHRLESVIPAS